MGRHDTPLVCRRCGAETPTGEPIGRLMVQMQSEQLVTSPWSGERYEKRCRMAGPSARLCPDCARDAQEMIETWCEEEKHDSHTKRQAQ